ncbi:hypothetical protein F4809DRAFT_592946 [Biscogniauxia mediterranea]|nr:hypothetical protein F4809DRAFT_592946 [Biscogniauxia mediterranea]
MDQTTSLADPAIGQGEPNAAASPASQKRARDYGQELKGLTPSGDESDRDLNSTPAPKKQKRDYDAGASDSGDLDDGEIVESTSPPPGPVESYYQSKSPVDGKPPAGPGLHDALRKSPGVGDVDGAILEDLGRPGDPRDPSEALPTPTTQHQPVPLSGWNQGVSLGSRTSFGKGRATPLPAKPVVAVESLSSSPVSVTHEKAPDGNSTQKTPTAGTGKKDRARSPNQVATFEASNLVWNFPTKRASKIDTKAGEAQDRSFWLRRLKPWVFILLQVNPDEAARLTHKVVRAGFEIYLTRKMGYLQGTKKQVNAARVAAQEAMSSLSKQKLEDMISEAREKLKAGDTRDNPCHVDEEGDSEPDRSLSDNDDDDDRSLSPEGSVDEEIRQQRKYFPGAEDPSEHCLSCSAIGHRAHQCPQNTCRFCSSMNHNAFGCPTRKRCAKCHQLGHVMETCQEKLALASDELDGCAICGAGHLDDDCSEIWRSYNPLEVARKKVKSIPSFCYNCGAQNHYGPECGLPSKGPKVTGPTTWSQANRDLYVDPESEKIAIGWAGIDLNHNENETLPDFRLRGRATRSTHTHFVSSDESEEDLVHAPVDKPRLRGAIRIASNIGSVSQARDEASSWQPPLPPGPPPPGPQSSLPSAPHSLPPRPRTFGSNGETRPANRAGRGGRGGSRGRGRGRGRGR